MRLVLGAGGAAGENEDVQDIAVIHADPVKTPHHKVLKLLLEHTPASARALCRAVERHSPQWAKQLTDAGADANARPEPWKAPPLQMALEAPGTESPDTIGQRLLKVLLDAGANPNEPLGRPGMYQPLPLTAAADQGAGWAIRPLIEGGANVARAQAQVRKCGTRGNNNGTCNALVQLFAAGA